MITQKLSHLLTSRHFIELEQFLNKPNLFSALRVQQHEIRHSKFLAYLLDPNETHGLGTAFIENFLLWLSQITDKDILIHDLELDMASVTPEWPRKNYNSKDKLDIFIDIPPRLNNTSNPPNNQHQGLVVAIECKINSIQSDGQLAKYTEILKKNGYGIALPSPPQSLVSNDTEQFKQNECKTLICAFLTISGEDCGDANIGIWDSVTYTDLVLNTLETTLLSHGNVISEKIGYILDDYKETILELSDEKRGDEIESLCKSLLDYKDIINNPIYSNYLEKKHGRATEKLKQYIAMQDNKRSVIKNIFQDFCKDNKSKITCTSSNSTNLRFYPLARELYPLAVDKSLIIDRGDKSFYRWVEDGFPLLFEFFLQDSESSVKLRLNLVFGPLSDEFNEDRKDLIERLKSVDSLPDKWKLKIRNNITTLFTGIFVYTEVVNIDDADQFIEIVNVLLEAAKALADKIDPVLRNSFLAKQAASSL